jgi:penicillin-binding protein 2
MSIQKEQLYRNQMTLKLSVFMAVIFLILAIRLLYLQVYEHEEYLRLSEKNRIRLKVIEAPRGLIQDRTGKVLARNRSSYQISLLPVKLQDRQVTLEKLLKIEDALGNPFFDSSHVDYMMQRGRWRRFSFLPILEDAPMEIVSMIEERESEFPGITPVVESRREYPHGTLAAHLIGYTAEISDKDFARYKEIGYKLGEHVGAKGLEKQYEAQLRGKEGQKFIEVNVYGKELGALPEMGGRQATPGHNLVTTLDLSLQKIVEHALPDSMLGAIVILDPEDGGILAMASSPRIDGNIFSLAKKPRSKEWAKVALDSRRPLNNRATIGLYDPGSTFKLISSLAAFKSGLLGPKEHLSPCTGGYQMGNRYQRCWLEQGHGPVDFYEAFKRSCNTYYYQLGIKLGIDPINEVAREFGLGQKTGVDLPSERSGVLMDSVFYERKFKSRGWKWTKGLVLNLAIGQGQLVTPIQLANMVAGVANGSTIYKPHLMKEIRDYNGNLIEVHKPEVLKKLTWSSEQREYVLEAMRQVVEVPGGTGRQARIPRVVMGGKTGSAQNPLGKTHALFVGLAPLEKPELAIAVVLENAGHGGDVAAPIAGKILRQYFGGSLGRSGN